MAYSLTYSPTYLFTSLLPAHSLHLSLTCLLTPVLMHRHKNLLTWIVIDHLTSSLAHPLTQSLIHSPTLALTYWLTCVRTYSLIFLLTHSHARLLSSVPVVSRLRASHRAALKQTPMAPVLCCVAGLSYVGLSSNIWPCPLSDWGPRICQLTQRWVHKLHLWGVG